MLKPKAYLDSVLQLTPEWMRARGLEAMLVDLDNTLVPYGYEGSPSPELLAWVLRLKEAGIGIYLVSNARRGRLRRWARMLGVEGAGLAGKPWFGFRGGLKKLGLSPSQVAAVGDQVFTDVLDGNLLGLYTVLVKPISQDELAYTRMVRRLERLVLGRSNTR